jgi:C4-dicarboxylate-specific signal transduction histidine kinase
MHDGLAILSHDLRLMYVNDRFAEMLQVPGEQLLDRPVLDLVQVADRESLAALLEDPDRDAVREISWNILHGRCVTLAAPGRSAGMEDEDAPHFLVVTEITRQKLAEEKLRAAHHILEERVEERTRDLSLSNARLEQEIEDRSAAEAQGRELQAQLAHATRITSLGQFATGIAHEINQPLGAIATFSDTLRLMLQRSSASKADLEQTVERIRDAALRAGQILSRMRSFLKARPVNKQPVLVNSLITDVLELCTGELRQHRIRVDARLTETDGETVEVDAIQIQQVFMNVLHNAIQAMAEVTDTPRILTIESKCDENGVRVAITDTGPGFPVEWLGRELARFRSTKGQGLGMGLSISQTLVKLYRGELSIENVAPRGARVSFHLPVPQHVVADHLCCG